MDEIITIERIDGNQMIAESTAIAREAFIELTSKRQLDLIYAIITLVRPEHDRFYTYYLPFREICRIFNPANPRTRLTKESVEQAIDSIMDCHFNIYKGNKVWKYHWIETAFIDSDEEYITFRLNDDVRHFYLDLQPGAYALMQYKDMLAMQTIFQVNVFRWVSANSNIEKMYGRPAVISVERARDYFGAKDMRSDSFFRNIDNAIKRINDKTELSVSYTKEMEGRKVKNLVFRIVNQRDAKALQAPEKADRSEKEKYEARSRARKYVAHLKQDNAELTEENIGLLETYLALFAHLPEEE